MRGTGAGRKPIEVEVNRENGSADENWCLELVFVALCASANLLDSTQKAKIIARNGLRGATRS